MHLSGSVLHSGRYDGSMPPLMKRKSPFTVVFWRKMTVRVLGATVVVVGVVVGSVVGSVVGVVVGSVVGVVVATVVDAVVASVEDSVVGKVVLSAVLVVAEILFKLIL